MRELKQPLFTQEYSWIFLSQFVIMPSNNIIGISAIWLPGGGNCMQLYFARSQSLICNRYIHRSKAGMPGSSSAIYQFRINLQNSASSVFLFNTICSSTSSEKSV